VRAVRLGTALCIALGAAACTALPANRCFRNFVIVALACTSLLACTAAFAAGRTLDELMRRAVVQNADIKAARAQVAAAVGRLKQAGLWPNPRLGLSNENSADGAYARSVAVSQDFPIAGRIGTAQNVARVDVARALAEVNEAERKLLGDVLSTYFEVMALDQKLAVRDRLISIQQTLVDASAARNKTGEVSELDVNAAMLELERLREEHTVFAAERVAKLRTLAGLVALDSDVPLNVITEAPPLAGLPALSKLTDRALERRPDLRLLELSANRALAEQGLARASAWEDWTVSLGARQDKLVVEGAPPQRADKSLMLTLTVPLPLFNQNQGTIAVAVADEVTARERANALELRIKNEVAGEYGQATALLDVAKQFNVRALPLAQRTAALARDAYSKGQLSMTEVVQIERQEIDINTSYIDALAQYLTVISNLRTSTVAYAPIMTHLEQTSGAQSGEQ